MQSRTCLAAVAAVLAIGLAACGTAGATGTTAGHTLAATTVTTEAVATFGHPARVPERGAAAEV